MTMRLLVILPLLALLAGCATPDRQPQITLPAISDPPTNRSNPGQVIWHDLATRDLDRAKRFYEGLFGWSFEQLNPEGRQYTVIYQNGSPIGGMFTFTSEDTDKRTGEWLVNLSSANVEADAAAIAKAGGKILEPPRPAPDRGTAAFVRDPQEAVMILTQSSSGDPEDDFVPMGGWLWNELWTHDAAAAVELYTGLFQYESEPVDTGDGRNYVLLSKDGIPVGGILEMKEQDIRPHWVPFIRVANVELALARAISLGATILIDADPTIRNGEVALLQGPTGEPFVIQEYSFENP